MKTKKQNESVEKETNKVSEPQAAYETDMNALKLAGIHALISIDNPSILQKAVKTLVKTAGQSAPKPAVDEEEETIGKEEILSAIREGLLEMKERQRTGRKGETLQELIDEL
ncbi:MAG TPA: hypothetical protein DDZ96_06155 [Porphyromonadaceae bacterium]|jgi:hypothetical protein|uniref:hypothetical protein n=1 Tax=Limibacterium fermenti TaxID=3229863 RepID=UPI000E9E9A3F|nr:hypothetical protein [Porphyromonadaceae bacterium]HBK32785.1 hypothetical protein [Porphyromonadaceae bacterium]HBL33390.1 hypothetical protein [Porphyromonadaceae bacterium]HBX45022.1 hypothetical protein [Porphyromonadaceae bacterium]